MSEPAQIDESRKARAEARVRLGKLFGMLGSDHAGERANALSAIEETLPRSGLNWRWIGELVARGDLGDPEREKLLADLVSHRLLDGLQYAFAMTGEEARVVREICSRCGASGEQLSLTDTSPAAIRHAVAIASEAKRKVKGT